MAADQEGPRVDLSIRAQAPPAGLWERLVGGQESKEVRDVPEQRSGDEDGRRGEASRELIAWLGVLVTLGWLWKNRRTGSLTSRRSSRAHGNEDQNFL